MKALDPGQHKNGGEGCGNTPTHPLVASDARVAAMSWTALDPAHNIDGGVAAPTHPLAATQCSCTHQQLQPQMAAAV